MALDLQTKLQQAKLKIFGLNPANDDAPGNSGSHTINSKKHMDFYDFNTNDLDETELFGKDKLINFENMFKQNVREVQKPFDSLTNVNINSNSINNNVNNETTKLPGVTSLKNFKTDYLTQDIAARKIQHAFRQHLIRKRQRLIFFPKNYILNN